MPWSKDNLPPSVADKNWSDSQKAVFVATANAILEKTSNEGEAIATGTKQAEEHDEKKNDTTQNPRLFYCRHMQPGVCGYANETVLVDTDALKRMIPTAEGIPVFIDHIDGAVDLSTIKEKAAGYVVESFYNELDGWAWFKFLAVDDAAHNAHGRGMAVSNAYVPTQWGTAGKKNNVPYHREVLNGRFTHLAIVKNPRYEEAKIMTPDEYRAYNDTKRAELEELRNSKSDEGAKPMFKLFKNEKKEVTNVDKDTMVELEGGQTVTVAQMLNALEMQNKKNSEEEDKKKEDEKKNKEDPMIKCNDGEEMPLSELINKYNSMCQKKNEEEKAKEKEEEQKKNALEAEEKAKKEEGKKHFEELQNANKGGTEQVQIIQTSASMLKRGKDNY